MTEEQKNSMDQHQRWKFLHPFTARFVGPTSCGKTTFLKRILDQKLIDPWVTSIIYFYGSNWQSPMFDQLAADHDVTFVAGFNENLVQSRTDTTPVLVICDDLVLEMKDSETAANLFMRGSHHLNMSVILIEQSLFPKGRQSVSMKQNSHYTVVFKSPSDAQGIAVLARQMYPQKGGKFLIDSFHDCTQAPFSYLIIDTKQSTPDALRLISRIDDLDHPPVVYSNSSNASREQILHFNKKDTYNSVHEREPGDNTSIEASTHEESEDQADRHNQSKNPEHSSQQHQQLEEGTISQEEH